MDCVSKVEGNMFGKSFTAIGSRNSINGTMIKTKKGRSRKTSAHVLRNCNEHETAVMLADVCLSDET